MFIVRKLLEGKSESAIHTVSPNETVLQALQIMEGANTGAVLVMEGGKVVGIFTERDYARQGEIKGRHAEKTLVSEVMSPHVMTVDPETTLQECAELMRKNRLRHLPVVEKDHVIGMVSIRGLAEGLLEEQKNIIYKLEDFIQGTGYGR